MNEIYESNPITTAQNLVLANTTQDLKNAMEMIHFNCLTQPMELSREFSRHLDAINKAILIDYMREAAKNGSFSEDDKELSAALEDVNNFLSPVFSSPILSQKACQLAVKVKELSSLKDYCTQRAQLLDKMHQLAGEEAGAISGYLVERLTDLLLFYLLQHNANEDKVLTRQIQLWAMLYNARKEGQLQLAAYFLELDKDETVKLLLPCCLPVGAPVMMFYRCAATLKMLAYQKDVWEYDAFVRSLHDRVEREVLRRIQLSEDNADTMALEELYALLRAVMNSHSPVVWEHPYFEKIMKKLGGN